MTDLKPGSRWLLPVTYGGPDHSGYIFWSDAHHRAIFYEQELNTLIPADRITELEAEVARLKSELEKLNAHD